MGTKIKVDILNCHLNQAWNFTSAAIFAINNITIKKEKREEKETRLQILHWTLCWYHLPERSYFIIKRIKKTWKTCLQGPWESIWQETSLKTVVYKLIEIVSLKIELVIQQQIEKYLVTIWGAKKYYKKDIIWDSRDEIFESMKPRNTVQQVKEWWIGSHTYWLWL